MSVSSWRFLPSFALSFESPVPLTSWTKFHPPKSKLIAVALWVCFLTACVGTPPTRSVFKTPGISPAQWSRIDDECSYEAEKATASADSKTAVSYTWNKLYVMCAELKGATYVGRVSMPEDRWQQVKALCKGEAELAVAKQASSRNRDELKEDLELECMKRNGAKFQQSYYP